MNEKMLVSVVTTAVDHMREDIKQDILTEVKRALESYRNAVYVRDTWCCKEIERFAAKFWHVSKPNDPTGTWGTRLLLRGETVNFCPFCGVHIGAVE